MTTHDRDDYTELVCTASFERGRNSAMTSMTHDGYIASVELDEGALRSTRPAAAKDGPDIR
jgi:hypothetical protein